MGSLLHHVLGILVTLGSLLTRSHGSWWQWWRRGSVSSQHGLELCDIELGLRHHCWRRTRATEQRDWLRRRRQVLVRVESTDGCNVSDVRYLDHRVLLPKIVAHVLVGREVLRERSVGAACTTVFNGTRSSSCRIVAVIIIFELIIVTSFL